MNDDTLLHIMMRQHGSFPNYFSDSLSLLESDEIVSLLTSRNKQGEKPIDFVLNADKCSSECCANFSRLAQHDNTAIHKILTYRDELGDTVLHSLNCSEHKFVLKAICEHFTESNRLTISSVKRRDGTVLFNGVQIKDLLPYLKDTPITSKRWLLNMIDSTECTAVNNDLNDASFRNNLKQLPDSFLLCMIALSKSRNKHANAKLSQQLLNTELFAEHLTNSLIRFLSNVAPTEKCSKELDAVLGILCFCLFCAVHTRPSDRPI